MKLCLVCSQGGHFEEMMRLTDAFHDYNYFFVTFESASTAHLTNAYFLKFKGWDWKGKLLSINTTIKSLEILIKERPDWIITTGGGEIAVPICYIGKLLGMKIVFIETLSRIESASAASKFIYGIADVFLIQWEFNKKKYGRKTKYWGQII